MNKAELKHNHTKYKRLMQYRVECEGRVIEALPVGLNVTRIVGPKALDSPEHASVEFEVQNYLEALALMWDSEELAPIPLSQVNAERVPTRKTLSFMPSARIPRRWHEDGRCQIGEIYPVLYQLAPGNDPALARVMLEWYAELKHELFVNVRVVVKGEMVFWHKDPRISPHRVNSWSWPDAPKADCGRVLAMNGGLKPPLVTLWWYKGTPDDHFRRALVGAQEVAHVK